MFGRQGRGSEREGPVLMRESTILHRIMLALGAGAVRVFRNNTGSAWQGDVQRLQDGSVLIRNPRFVRFGLCPGSSDLIGWRSVEVTPEMVGSRLAVFTAIEVKSEEGRLDPEQVAFLEQVRQAGGIGVEARSAEAACTGVLDKR